MNNPDMPRMYHLWRRFTLIVMKRAPLKSFI